MLCLWLVVPRVFEVTKRAFNPKRRLGRGVSLDTGALKNELRYTGNPEHKRNPGDFGLTPPSSPRPAKSLCDTARIFTRAEALRLLQLGLERGAFSAQLRNGWPQNIWAVTEDGVALEAQLDGAGTYHGYPMPETDPFKEELLAHWNQS